jgi:hypothetical protein
MNIANSGKIFLSEASFRGIKSLEIKRLFV